MPGALSHITPDGEDWIGRRLRHIERRLDELSTSLTTSLQGDSVDDWHARVTLFSEQSAVQMISESDDDLAHTSVSVIGNANDGGPAVAINVGVDVGSGAAGQLAEFLPDGLAIYPVQWRPGNSEWQAIDAVSKSYVPVHASSFPTSSSRAVKDVIDEAVAFDTVEAIKAAPVAHWRYKPEFANEGGRSHVGPFAEDLPTELTHTNDDDGVLSVDTTSLIGVLWDAVSKLAARVEALEAKRAHP